MEKIKFIVHLGFGETGATWFQTEVFPKLLNSSNWAYTKRIIPKSETIYIKRSKFFRLKSVIEFKRRKNCFYIT